MSKPIALGQGTVVARFVVEDAMLSVLVWKNTFCFVYCAVLTLIVQALSTVVQFGQVSVALQYSRLEEPVITTTVPESTLISAIK